MASGSQKRTRSERVAAVQLPPGLLSRLFGIVRRRDVLMRLGLCALAIVAMWAITGGWAPPFSFRNGDTPARDIVARVDFSVVDHLETEKRREEARRNITVVYQHDPALLVQLQQELKGKIFQILRAPSFYELDESVRQQFFEKPAPDMPSMVDETREDLFDQMRVELEDDKDLAKFEESLKRGLADIQSTGLLEELQHTSDEGTLTSLLVYPVGNPTLQKVVNVDELRIAKVLPRLKDKLAEEVTLKVTADRAWYWLSSKLSPTLTKDADATRQKATEAANLVEEVRREFRAHDARDSVLARGGVPLDQQLGAMDLLRAEYQARVKQLTFLERVWYTLADMGMYIALFTLCGCYIYFQQPRLLHDMRRFASVLAVVVVAVALARLASVNQWQAELIPAVLFAMTVAIIHRHELALLLSASVTLVIVVSLGLGLSEFTVLMAAMSAAILLLGRVRSRTKLLYVGLAAGGVAMLTSLGVGTLTGSRPSIDLLILSLWLGFYAGIAGLLMTGLLPFIEKLFDVQTDISLLELGDASHPLLQELVRRAPGTYNHSINVASIAEAAADSIGANGLLCRVGAYFHDIGKMLKPGYFIENQSNGDNRHESLMPAMSTLVIIAHVKDGADLARQHGLPQSIIDFIQQHHGTTLVEYFYRRASQQSESQGDGSRVEESDFRYPGPKPQTRESGVVMLSDSVESACRTLVEPTPSRIENLVEDLAMKRLLDGQFDESGLTLSELRVIQSSLVKSLTAVYHGRVKYPDQATA